MLLIVFGRQITRLDAPSLQYRFGRQGLGRPDWIDDILEFLINDDQHVHRFRSSEVLARTILQNRMRINPLQLWFLHRHRPGPYLIEMQGRRRDDEIRANRAAGLVQTPDNYTWHHAENIIFNRPGSYSCNMYLIESNYHNNTPHTGGVNEYEFFTGIEYH